MEPDRRIALRDLLAELNQTGLVMIDMYASDESLLAAGRAVLRSAATCQYLPATIGDRTKEEVLQELRGLCES